jgi:hypothetical protein
MTWYTERTTATHTLTLGDTTAFSATVNLRNFAGAAVLLPADFTGTLELQATHNDTDWAACHDSSGTLITIADTNAGAWISLHPDLFPLPNIRFALTDGAGTPTPGATNYTLTLVLKS